MTNEYDPEIQVLLTEYQAINQRIIHHLAATNTIANFFGTGIFVIIAYTFISKIFEAFLIVPCFISVGWFFMIRETALNIQFSVAAYRVENKINSLISHQKISFHTDFPSGTYLHRCGDSVKQKYTGILLNLNAADLSILFGYILLGVIFWICVFIGIIILFWKEFSIFGLIVIFIMYCLLFLALLFVIKRLGDYRIDIVTKLDEQNPTAPQTPISP